MGIDLMGYDRLVMHIARKYGAKDPIKDSDQYSLGWIGLSRAAKMFDPTKGFQFSTLATIWIINSIKNDWEAKKAQSRGSGKKIIRFSEIDKPGRERKDLKFDPHDCNRVSRNSNEIEEIYNREECEYLLDVVNPREREIFILHFCDGYSYKELGLRYSVSSQRIKQIVDSAKYKINSLLEEREGDRCSLFQGCRENAS